MVRIHCWCGCDSSDEFINDQAEMEEPEDREDVRLMYEDELPALTSDFNDHFESWMLSPKGDVHHGFLPRELQDLFQLPERKYPYTETPYFDSILPGILLWNDELIYDCFDHIYNQAMNDGREIVLNALYWKFHRDNAHLSETFDEIENAVRSLGKLLMILNQLHQENEFYGNYHSQRTEIPA